MKIALILLTLNELEGCTHDIPLIDQSQFDEIYCIDGGSTDGTIEFLEENGITVYRQIEKGLNQACKEGVSHCNSDAFIFFHPKGTIPVEDIYKFRKYFEDGFEFVVGSRMIKGGYNEEDCKLFRPRKWFVLFLGYIAACLFHNEGTKIKDVLHGFRGMTVRAFTQCTISDMSPSVDIEMVCRSYKLKINRIEFPTIESPRIAGSTHFKAFETGKKLLKYIWFEKSRDSY